MAKFAACPGISLEACVSDEHRNLLLTIDPACPIPKSPNTIKKWLLNEAHDVYNSIVEEIQAFRSYLSATADVWTDSIMLRSYLGVTLHFIDRNKLKSSSLGVIELKGSHTAENIRARFEEKIGEFGLEYDDVYVVVTDSAASMKAAFRGMFFK
jgi:hypothetical protein